MDVEKSQRVPSFTVSGIVTFFVLFYGILLKPPCLKDVNKTVNFNFIFEQLLKKQVRGKFLGLEILSRSDGVCCLN